MRGSGAGSANQCGRKKYKTTFTLDTKGLFAAEKKKAGLETQDIWV